MSSRLFRLRSELWVFSLASDAISDSQVSLGFRRNITIKCILIDTVCDFHQSRSCNVTGWLPALIVIAIFHVSFLSEKVLYTYKIDLDRSSEVLCL